jgi:hypothetical protein
VAAGLPALQEVARAVVITEITPPGPYDFLAGCTPSPQEMTWRPWAS